MFPLSLWLCTSFVSVRSSFALIIYSPCPEALFPPSLKSLSDLVVLLSNNYFEYCLTLLTDSFRWRNSLHFFYIFPKVSHCLELFSLKICTILFILYIFFSFRIVTYTWNGIDNRIQFSCKLQIFHLQTMDFPSIQKDRSREEIKSFLIKSQCIDTFYFVRINFGR